MKHISYILLFLLAACNKPAPVEERPNVLTLKEMSDLATVEYTVTKIIKASDNKTWFKVGDRKILMSCTAYIKAGIDMSEITTGSFKINGKTINVTLPPPKIITLNIPPEAIRTEYEEVGALRDKYSAADRDALAAQAETDIRNSIDSMGILNQAKVNTSLFVTNFLKNLGYQNIQIGYSSINKNTFE